MASSNAAGSSTTVFPGDSGCKTTPRRRTKSSAQPFAASPALIARDTEYREMAHEMKDFTVGPMPFDDFLARYMPAHKHVPGEKWFRTKSEELRNIGYTEDQFITAVKDSGLCKNLEFVNTTTRPDPKYRPARKVDISVYAKRGITPTYCDWGKNILPAERKEKQQDPFRDTPVGGKDKDRKEQTFYKCTDEAMKTYGQVISYCVAMRECQDRTHCFALLILGNQYVRVLRWDQVGIIVTERIDVLDHPEKFGKFLWLFDGLSDSERGIDPTIHPATKAHKDAAWKLLTQKYGIPPHSKQSLRQFEVRDPTLRETRIYIAGNPRWSVRSPLGRGTRGFFAYGVTEKRLVYLKDTWRIDTPEFEREGDTYRRLNERLKAYEVEPFVPTLLCDGDVPGQATITQDYKDEWWCFRTEGLQRHQHYRLVFREIGHNLWDFRHIKEVCQAIYEALRVHRVALDQFGILHRDISLGNILIGEDGHGLLIDWDLARQVPRPGNTLEDEQDEVAIRKYLKPGSSSSSSSAGDLAPTRTSRSSSSQVRRFDDEYWFPALTPLYRRRLCRSGAWQFISGLLLKDPAKDHERADDLESSLYVLLYVAFRYQESSLSDEALAKSMEKVFDQHDAVKGVHSGGEGKQLFLISSTLPPEVIKASFPVALSGLINTLRDVFATLYATRPRPPDDVDAADREDQQIKWDRYNEDQKHARATLSTSDKVIAIFKRFLDMPDSDWGEGQPSKDRLERLWISEETVDNKRQREQLQEILMANKKRATGAGIHSG